MKRLVLSVFMLLMSAGCATTAKVYTDFDPQQDFSTYKTFSWVNNDPALVSSDYSVSALTKTRMTQAIKDKLISLGYEFIENPQQADFTLLYTIGARDKIKINEYPVHNTFYRDRYLNSWRSAYYPYFRPSGQVVYEQVAIDYVQGVIAIDIFDGKTRQGVWHAMASKRLSSTEMQANGENSNLVADALFVGFPPE